MTMATHAFVRVADNTSLKGTIVVIVKAVFHFFLHLLRIGHSVFVAVIVVTPLIVINPYTPVGCYLFRHGPTSRTMVNYKEQIGARHVGHFVVRLTADWALPTNPDTV